MSAEFLLVNQRIIDAGKSEKSMPIDSRTCKIDCEIAFGCVWHIGVAYTHLCDTRIQNLVAMRGIAHPPVEGSLRVATAIDNLRGPGGGVPSGSDPLTGRGAIRAAVADESVTSLIDAVSLRCSGKRGVDGQWGQSSLGAGRIDQVGDLIEIG